MCVCGFMYEWYLRYRTGSHASLYKYLNPHLIAIATLTGLSKNAQSLFEDSSKDTTNNNNNINNNNNNNKNNNENMANIYLIDGITGRTYDHTYHKHASLPISTVLYENRLIYSFWNTNDLMSEINILELWLNDYNDLPHNARAPAEGYYVTPNPLGIQNIFSSFNAPLPVITTRSYHFIKGYFLFFIFFFFFFFFEQIYTHIIF